VRISYGIEIKANKRKMEDEMEVTEITVSNKKNNTTANFLSLDHIDNSGSLPNRKHHAKFNQLNSEILLLQA
jgi:hypothetical protein